MEKKITNTLQFNKLVEEMEKNPSLAKGFQKGSMPCDFKEQWERIATLVNALGPPIRSGDGWQKVWRDLKFKVKKKLVANKAECTSTGGGIYKQSVLSPLEEAVANLLQFQKQLNPAGAVQGVRSTVETNDLVVQDSDNEIDILPPSTSISNKPASSDEQLLPPSTSSQSGENCTPSKRKSKSTSNKPASSDDQYKLLQKHSDEQAHILKEINNSILSLKRNVKDYSRYSKEILELKKKKFQLMMEENERKKEQHDVEIKIKRMKLLIIEKELGALDKS